MAAPARGRQRTDSIHILVKIRSLNRTLCVAQTMVYVLNVLSEVAPDWIRQPSRLSAAFKRVMKQAV